MSVNGDQDIWMIKKSGGGFFKDLDSKFYLFSKKVTSDMIFKCNKTSHFAPMLFSYNVLQAIVLANNQKQNSLV